MKSVIAVHSTFSLSGILRSGCATSGEDVQHRLDEGEEADATRHGSENETARRKNEGTRQRKENRGGRDETIKTAAAAACAVEVIRPRHGPRVSRRVCRQAVGAVSQAGSCFVELSGVCAPSARLSSITLSLLRTATRRKLVIFAC